MLTSFGDAPGRLRCVVALVLAEERCTRCRGARAGTWGSRPRARAIRLDRQCRGRPGRRIEVPATTAKAPSSVDRVSSQRRRLLARGPTCRTDRSPWLAQAGHRLAVVAVLRRHVFARASATSPLMMAHGRRPRAMRASHLAPRRAFVGQRSRPDGTVCSTGRRRPCRCGLRLGRRILGTPPGSGS